MYRLLHGYRHLVVNVPRGRSVVVDGLLRYHVLGLYTVNGHDSVVAEDSVSRAHDVLVF